MEGTESVLYSAKNLRFGSVNGTRVRHSEVRPEDAATCGMSIIRVPLWRRRLWKIEQFENFGIVHFFRPGSRCGPWLRVGFHGIGSAREKQLNHLNVSTPAGPPERSAFE